jgi:glycosyltransferase involved in cell wall biosynthesis
MRPLRIVQINTSDLGGGAAKTAWKLHHAFRKRGHASLLCVGRKLSSDRDVIEIDNSRRGRSVSGRVKVELEWRLGRQYLDFPGSHKIPEAVGQPWDVTHAHNLHGHYFDLAALQRLTRLAPTILTLHDMWLLTGHCAHSFSCERWRSGCGSCPDLTIYPEIRRDSTRANLRRKRRLMRDLELTVTSPAAWALDLVAASHLAEKPKRLMPHPVDTRVFAPGDKAEARAQLGLPLERPLVLLPAWDAFASDFKGASVFETAIRALRNLRPLGVTFGAEPSRDADDLWIEPLSFDESHVARFYRAADVVVVSSRAETLPLAIIESFASARPVVATKIGGIPELVTHGRDGLLVDVDDVRAFTSALRLLLESPELASQFGSAGLETARSRYDLDRVADLWLDWYLGLAEGFHSGQDRLLSTAPSRS